MRVLVTGCCGFIGSHLAEYLQAMGHDVVGLDRLDETASLGYGPRSLVLHDLQFPIGTGLGLLELQKTFDWVCHLAAFSHVDRSVRDPLQAIKDNVVGTANLLEWARRNPPRKFLYFSTDEVFGPAEDGEQFSAWDRLLPKNPYAASKAAAEVMLPAWASTYGLPIVVTHCTNVYGPRQHPEKLIPLVVRQIRNGATVQVHVRDTQVASRKWVHVSDVCRAVLAILERGGVMMGAHSGRYNISADEEVSVDDVVRGIGEQLGIAPRMEAVEDPPGRPRPDMRYDLDDEPTRQLGWKPQVAFALGLKETVLWYLEHDPARAA